MTREDFRKLSKPEQKAAKAEAFEALKEAVKDSEEGTAALKILKPSLFGIVSTVGRSSGEPKWLTFSNLFEKKNSTVDEMKLFQEMKIGRHECRTLIKDTIRKASDETRKWIEFNPETGLYTLVKIGKDAPADWTGYVPTEKLEDEDVVSLI